MKFALGVNPGGAESTSSFGDFYHGHTTLYFQDSKGDWFSFDQGVFKEPPGPLFLNFDAEPHVEINRIKTPPSSAIIFPSSYLEDNNITQCAIDSNQDHNDLKKYYNVYSNNCTDAAVDVLACAGIRVINPSFKVRPNDWFPLLKNNPPKRCKLTSRGIRCR